jgi:signal transduction histidine kinase
VGQKRVEKNGRIGYAYAVVMTISANEPLVSVSSSAPLHQQIDALNQRAWGLVREDRPEAKKLSQRALQLAKSDIYTEQHYLRGIAESLRTLSRISLLESKYEQGLVQALEGLALTETYAFNDIKPSLLYTIASSYLTLGNIGESLDWFLKLQQICEEMDNEEGIAMALLGLGNVYSEVQEFEQAADYFQKSFLVFRDLQESYWIALLLNNISFNYLKLKDFANALKWGQECLAYSRETQHTRIEGIVSNSLAEIYITQNEPDKALTYLESSFQLASQQDDPHLALESLMLSGKIYLQKENALQAELFLKEALTLAEQVNHRRFIYECHKALVDVYKYTGDFQRALAHYEQYHAVWQTLLNEESSRKLKNLEVVQRTQSAQREAELYAFLYREEQSRRQLAETLHQVGVVLTGSLDLQTVLDTILEQLATLVPYDRASILLKRGNYLEFVALRGFPDGEKVKQSKVMLEEDESRDVFLRIYHTREPLALMDLADYEGWQQVSNLPVPGAWLGMPLLYRDEVRGMISLVRAAPVAYDAEAIQLAMTLAAPAAVALENARLYNRTKRFNEQMEYEVAQRTAALQEAYEQLERLDRAKGDFITVTAHELRTPITVIKAYAQLLDKSLPQPNEAMENLLRGIISGTNRLHEVVNTMLVMVKIDSKDLQIFAEPQQLGQLVQRVVDGLRPDLGQRQLSLAVGAGLDDLPEIEADEDALVMLLENLVVNAVKYTPDGGQVIIDGRYWSEPPFPDWPADAVELTVQDTGIGIDPAALELIFTKFYQTGNVSLHSSGKVKFKGGGPGLGLAIAKGIVDGHYGRIWAESTGHDEVNCPGTTIHVILPRLHAHRTVLS